MQISNLFFCSHLLKALASGLPLYDEEVIRAASSSALSGIDNRRDVISLAHASFAHECSTTSSVHPKGVGTLKYTLCLGRNLSWESASCSSDPIQSQVPSVDSTTGLAHFHGKVTPAISSWRNVPSERTRKSISAYYVGEEGSCIDAQNLMDPLRLGGRPRLVVRALYYCADEDTTTENSYQSILERVEPVLVHGTNPFLPSGFKQEAYACLLDAFVSVPSLCEDPEFDPSGIARFEDILKAVYADSMSGYKAPEKLNEPRPREDTYGEVTVKGVMEMLHQLPLGFQINNMSQFVDLGSGIGKMVLQVAIMTDAAKVTGIELSEERASTASAAKRRSFGRGMLSTEESQKIKLLQGDAFLADGRSEGATHIYVSNLCFPPELNDRLVLLLQELENSIQCVMTLRELPIHQGTVNGTRCLRFVQARPVEMSWSKQFMVKYYCSDGCRN
eukprot:TRINITY_DN29327_c4_g1_i1.p1 TRINITY_DN29327_c4_g1~~TRINITY_DN29327_c4_g1_i1.p1  ORF type:complete len:447 (-),score=43.64 TRINITY_DN29327_c4_g1_i1:121-1461(-)